MILDRDGFGFWSFIAKKAFKATFVRPKQFQARDAISGTLREREVPVYIHIPFCKGKCRYCPNVTYPLRSQKSISNYVEALKAEICSYGSILKNLDLQVINIHAGGGTPSLLKGSQWGEILGALRENFDAEPGIAIEANPEDFASESHAFNSVNCGVEEVSVGVQSLDRRILKNLGRTHSIDESLKSIENLRNAGIDYLNADMMYMVPGQSLKEWNSDIEKVSELDIDEITCYPTLMTNQAPGYRLVKNEKIGQPSESEFKKMMYLAEEKLPSKSFEPVEIYGYSRKEGWKYVTVNYEMEGPLLGLGCGAMGFTGRYEWVNTCSLPEYISTALEGELPIAGARAVDDKERAIRYASCRLFVCRSLGMADFRRKFAELSELTRKSGFWFMVRLLRLIGFIKKKGNTLKLSQKGLFAAHQQCWSFVLNVPCRIAEEYMKEP